MCVVLGVRGVGGWGVGVGGRGGGVGGVVFFFNDTATTEIYTLSLHDALPISRPWALLATVGRHGPSSA